MYFFFSWAICFNTFVLKKNATNTQMYEFQINFILFKQKEYL